MLIRKNVNTLSSIEKQQFINAVLALKNNNALGNKYNQYVLRHSDASAHRTPVGSTRTVAHGGPAFLAWHRQFIYEFEQDLQTYASGLGLPYWNWAADAALPNPKTAPIWAGDFMGGNGNSNQSYAVTTGSFAYGKWTIINELGEPMQYSNNLYTGALKRQFGANVPTLPTQANVDTALSTVSYDSSLWDKTSNPSHRNKLEGWSNPNTSELHNRVHRWVGQTMRLMVSPNDPVFFLHHCNIDRLWAQWQAQNPSEKPYLPLNGGPYEHNLNDPMYPWSITPADLQNHRALAYKYDTEP